MSGREPDDLGRLDPNLNDEAAAWQFDPDFARMAGDGSPCSCVNCRRTPLPHQQRGDGMNDDELAAIAADVAVLAEYERLREWPLRRAVEAIEAERDAAVAALAEARAENPKLLAENERLQQVHGAYSTEAYLIFKEQLEQTEAALAEAHRTLADVEKLSMLLLAAGGEIRVPDNLVESFDPSAVMLTRRTDPASRCEVWSAVSRSGAESAGEQR